MRFDGKVALVTGAGRGIGRAIALAFAKEGADVVIAEVDIESARDVAKEIRSLGYRAEAIKTDVSKSAQVYRCVDKAIQTFGKIDILVNDAAIQKTGTAEELTEADWESIMDINLKGQFLFSQAVGKTMIRRKRGKIINIGSIGAHRVFFANAAYSASKAGVVALTRALAVEWAKYNINVNSVSPGTTMTEMGKEFPGIKERVKLIPLRRANSPEDIAKVVLFLASSEADNITGHDLIVDGGACALAPASAAVLLR